MVALVPLGGDLVAGVELVVRHRLVGRIVEAYEVFDAQPEPQGQRPRTAPTKADRANR